MKISNQNWLALLQKNKVIAVIRSSNKDLALQMAFAVAKGGVKLIEITWNSDRASETISQLRDELPGCTIGTGTLLTLEQQRKAIASGAQFLFTPHTDIAMIEASGDIPIIPGALSPTEIVTAWNAGASCVKVFPVQAVGGASYIKSLQAPLGHIPLIPTGGVTVDNAKSFLLAGASAIGLSRELFPQELVVKRDWEAIALRCQNLLKQLTGK
ncbi:bifunctional 4-hydroxy-2-oxoglutarate aldolase/2-dehydro-3-deoxy-phosphogluconate aldolase [Synechocystis sp. PCC 7509]|uniref:bifunctional 4-hydroxy-2-oxoglutarate aldolase/2-dehydro-3-deoxy-phosphogluconate aldolase n=1 Tax=Synechocystis sp. PCC 7509 TaxID=927677 RepID=UPI0002AC7BD8|nr:bifunctional 4-hydroxy-2-oxoglutarate aldolase/2-dehydro-3-deoxy-phosphogluconate aldolase [Synechocystis sp. PCC 7509]